jgi:hypothetical protein
MLIFVGVLCTVSYYDSSIHLFLSLIFCDSQCALPAGDSVAPA